MDTARERGKVSDSAPQLVSLRQRWRDQRLRTKGVVVLVLPLGMLPVAALVFYVTADQARAAQRLVSHTRDIQQQLQIVRQLVVDGETGTRGYLATGDREFLQPVGTAQQRLPGALATLDELVRDNRVQSDRVEQLRGELAAGYQFEPTAAPGTAAPVDLRGWLLDPRSPPPTGSGSSSQR